MSIFIDSNILIDVLSNDVQFGRQSWQALTEWQKRGQLWIDPMVYAELSAGYSSLLEIETFISKSELVLVEPSRAALFGAGQAFRKYRASGGTRTMLLPDFLIGANALDLEKALLTRDTKRYRNYFPDLQLIAPPQ